MSLGDRGPGRRGRHCPVPSPRPEASRSPPTSGGSSRRSAISQLLGYENPPRVNGASIPVETVLELAPDGTFAGFKDSSGDQAYLEAILAGRQDQGLRDFRVPLRVGGPGRRRAARRGRRARPRPGRRRPPAGYVRLMAAAGVDDRACDEEQERLRALFTIVSVPTHVRMGGSFPVGSGPSKRRCACWASSTRTARAPPSVLLPDDPDRAQVAKILSAHGPNRTDHRPHPGGAGARPYSGVMNADPTALAVPGAISNQQAPPGTAINQSYSSTSPAPRATPFATESELMGLLGGLPQSAARSDQGAPGPRVRRHPARQRHLRRNSAAHAVHDFLSFRMPQQSVSEDLHEVGESAPAPGGPGGRYSRRTSSGSMPATEPLAWPRMHGRDAAPCRCRR